MKRFLIILSLFLAFVNLQGQVLRVSPSYVAPVTVAGSSYNAEYDTVLASYATVPHDTIKTIQNTLVEQLVDSGYWARMDVLYIFANDDGTDALIDWITPDSTATNIHSTAFTAWQGFQGDGANDYIESNYNPNTDNIHYSLNSATVGIYLRQNDAAGTIVAVGSTDGTNRVVIIPRSVGNAGLYRMNSTDPNNPAWANEYTAGLFVMTRTASNVTTIYQGTTHHDGIEASTAIPDYEFYILAYNSSGSAAYHSSNQVSIVFVMDEVTDAEEAELNTIFETFMDSLYTGVQ